MQINNHPYRSIWLKKEDVTTVQIIDQRYLPHRLVIADLKTVADGVFAIREMQVRGAPLIGATAAYSIYLATLQMDSGSSQSDRTHFFKKISQDLQAARPTAVNLQWAVERQLATILPLPSLDAQIQAALKMAQQICEEDVATNFKIGQHGLALIAAISQKKGGKPVNILTHCNAGWLATVDWGTATSPIYQAHNQGLAVHVWVDETRPRNQGARITAFELGQHGVPHTVIVDNVGGHLMQHGMVDLCIVGTDRTTYTGDVANKIGTYLKALAAADNDVPFYVALPSSTIDWTMRNGLTDIPIEQRGTDEVCYIQGLENGAVKKVLLTPPDSPAANYAFDVTPARLVTGLITERGICTASEKGILALFPEKKYFSI